MAHQRPRGQAYGKLEILLYKHVKEIQLLWRQHESDWLRLTSVGRARAPQLLKSITQIDAKKEPQYNPEDIHAFITWYPRAATYAYFLIYSVISRVYKPSKEREKCPSQHPRASGGVMKCPVLHYIVI